MAKEDVCEVTCIDEEKVTKVKNELSMQNTIEVSKLFKALADDTRVKIAYSLSVEMELCVCDVANIVGCTVATASHHLRLLRNLGLATYRKEGKLVYYSLDDEHVKQLVNIAFTHQKEVALRGSFNCNDQ
ncbi:metalloregulator ArsR/SmtB family transcription factor [Robertmurraya korlensis]|uniref:ArsR/SmtB family transcription factor n=1 Tax=Robertmurraya korlensis TaxID=519977 RepID=UPI00203C08E9|nr:metalloregulator ArsR/SmtB family transcription factor [Robertmurraya korlensis]MCM3600754.1 metalloregulator ArsR/SmtB family transcription factor [Robertmurraya korlensis]